MPRSVRVYGIGHCGTHCQGTNLKSSERKVRVLTFFSTNPARSIPAMCCLLVTLAFPIGCTNKDDDSAAATNKLCSSDKSCPGTLTCGTGQSDRAQCVERCARPGPASESGCPEDTFCYVPPDAKEEGHCTLICSTDKDCQDRHPSLKCKGRTQTEQWALRICVLE